MKNISVLLVSIILFSCTNRTDSIDYKIRGKDFKYWILIWCNSLNGEDLSRFSEKNAVSLLYFDKNYVRYTAVRYNFDYEVLSFNHDNFPDIVSDNSWSLLNQETILLDNHKYKLKVLTEETMLLYDSLRMREFLYIKAPDSLIPDKYNKVLSDK